MCKTWCLCPPTLSVCIFLFCDYRCIQTQAPTQITCIHTGKPLKLEHTPNDQLSAFGLYRKGLREYEVGIHEARLWIRHTLGFTMSVPLQPGLRIGQWLWVLSSLQSVFEEGQLRDLLKSWQGDLKRTVKKRNYHVQVIHVLIIMITVIGSLVNKQI